MCGIFGFVSTSFFDYSKYNLGKMADRISHRGPDNKTVLDGKNYYLAFYRLAINDLTESGNQPFIYDNAVLLINGEIYNSSELKKKYSITTKSNSDCEVVIHLYRKLGLLETLKLLDGYFALCILDLTSGEFHIARDRLGVRSLFYCINENFVAVASEMKALSDLQVSLSRCEQFPPRSWKTWKAGEVISEGEYYQLPLTFQSSENVLENIKSLLEKAVEKRLLLERPFGCFLSGGLDSSLIASLLARQLKKTGSKLRTFSIGLKNSIDLKFAREVANYLETDHHEVIISKDLMLSTIPEVISVIESYDTTTVRASTPMYLLAKYIKENTDIKVVFSGEGSDELFGGYLYFKNAPNALEFAKENRRLLSDIHYFDALRADKCISAHGLEGRFPFLDNDFIDFTMSIQPELKMSSVDGGRIEKAILRDAFKGSYLPDNVLYRIKEAFSDGISDEKESWYTIIQKNIPSDLDFTKRYNHCQPLLRESFYYRSIFEAKYPNLSNCIPYYWLPKWSTTNDPSARTLKHYQSSTI